MVVAAGLGALAVVVAVLKPWSVSAVAMSEARPVTDVPFSTVTAIRDAGTAGAVAFAVAEAAADFLPEPVVSDWSLAMVENSVLAPEPTTTRSLLFGSAAVCIVVNVIRFVGTLFTSDASEISFFTLPSPSSTVSALVAASARS